VEKPVTETVEEAEKLIRLATERGRVLQVGHLERFNPAVQALRQHAQQPQRIEAQRLSVYQSRGTEVDVVLDLMIHDIDIVLSLVKSPIKSVHSSGTAVVTSDIDIAHARIEFDDGCVAELVASRVSQEPMRVMKVYKGGSYFAIDYITHELQIGTVADGHERQIRREVTFETGTIGRPDVLMAEISSFVSAVLSGSTPEVTGEDGKRALGVAIDVSQRIKRHRKAGISPDTQSG
jgi:predicted dehydrogenase